MKTTPFTEKHIALGAKMHEFAGYNMPIEYSGIIDEHLTVCNSVGVFDVSHMGEFWVKGPNALAFLQKVTSNNVAALTPGKIQYTCFPNEDGGIVDDLLVYHYEPEKYLLVVNAANMDKDWDWCVSHNTEGAELENSSDNIGQLAVQGPKAILALQKLTDVDLSSIPYYTFKVGKFAGEDNVKSGSETVGRSKPAWSQPVPRAAIKPKSPANWPKGRRWLRGLPSPNLRSGRPPPSAAPSCHRLRAAKTKCDSHERGDPAGTGPA